MEQVVTDAGAADRFNALLYVSFATIALLLAAIGIYSVMAFAVAQRTHEIGLRIALGAARGDVLKMVLSEGVVLTIEGLVLGIIGGCMVGRAMKSMLYGVDSIDPSAFGTVAIVLAVSALLACYIPARRAAKVDPMVALRYE